VYPLTSVDGLLDGSSPAGTSGKHVCVEQPSLDTPDGRPPAQLLR
jgi:hypothetical protein